MFYGRAADLLVASLAMVNRSYSQLNKDQQKITDLFDFPVTSAVSFLILDLERQGYDGPRELDIA